MGVFFDRQQEGKAFTGIVFMEAAPPCIEDMQLRNDAVSDELGALLGDFPDDKYLRAKPELVEPTTVSLIVSLTEDDAGKEAAMKLRPLVPDWDLAADTALPFGKSVPTELQVPYRFIGEALKVLGVDPVDRDTIMGEVHAQMGLGT